MPVKFLRGVPQIHLVADKYLNILVEVKGIDFYYILYFFTGYLTLKSSQYHC